MLLMLVEAAWQWETVHIDSVILEAVALFIGLSGIDGLVVRGSLLLLCVV